MRLRRFLIGATVLALIAGGGLLGAWSAGWFDSKVHDASSTTAETTPSESATLLEGLQLAKSARTKLHAAIGYRCLYLRDERINNEMNENYLKLAVRHEPFSVLMEWVDPPMKKGRKVAYVVGKNDGKMRLKAPLLPAFNLDLQESIKRKESRHTIAEAGLKNMLDRLVESWEEELKANETTTRYTDATVKVTVSGKHHEYACRFVETVHPESTKGKYVFMKTRVYFDRTTGLPVRMEGYDWPTTSHPEGVLVERYSYVEVDLNAVPQEKDFQL